MKTDREKRGLIGPVRTIDIKMAQLSQQNGECVERPVLSQTITYDIKGNKTEEASYTADGSLVTRTVFIYDHAWQLIEEIHYHGKKGFSGRSVYTYDGLGNVTEQARYTSTGHLANKKVCNYDAEGNRIEELFITDESSEGPAASFQVEGASYNAEGARLVKATYRADGRVVEVLFYDRALSLISKIVFTYDLEGNLIEDVQYAGASSPYGQELSLIDALATGCSLLRRVRVYDAERNKTEEDVYFADSLLTKKRFEYDPSGSKTRETEFEADGSLKSSARFSYEFNSVGDWTKETVSTRVAETIEFEPIAVKYRAISYY